LRLELANTLASLDKRTELILQELVGLRRDLDGVRADSKQGVENLRRDTEGWRGELRQDMRTLQSTVTRQMWTMVSVVTFAVLVGVIKLVLFP
jgi:hypothetical protein